MEMMMVSDLRLSLAEFLFSSSFWPPHQGSHSDEQHPTVLKICTCNNGPCAVAAAAAAAAGVCCVDAALCARALAGWLVGRRPSTHGMSSHVT